MPINLDNILDDKVLSATETSFLQNLQANILKGHGREHVALIFLEVDDAAQARAFLHRFRVTTARTQLAETEEFKNSGQPGGIVRLAFLSHAGMAKFGHGGAFPATLPAPQTAGTPNPFVIGMAADTAVLDGGSTASWQPQLKKPIDVLLLLAYHDETAFVRIVAKQVAALAAANSGFIVHFVQEGRAQRNGDGEGIEHFGYVDGRSQPLMTRTALDAEPHAVYDPKSPLKQFLVADPLKSGGFGSFFVFRKLEQNVAGFKQAEKDLARTLALSPADEERAGAMVVGRFEDGTPVTLHSSEQGVPVVNDFDYGTDPGGRCPFQGHIRKSNPRGSSPGGKVFDQQVQMARRGITYGSRLQDPDTKEFIDQPNDGVGLLFMSYQASIQDQFRFMQTAWVNNPDFPSPGVGVDPVIGQGGTPAQTWPPAYDSTTGGIASRFEGFVTLKGGEYFYAPSIGGLKNL